MNQHPGNNGGHPAWLRIDADEAPEPQHAAQPQPPSSIPHTASPPQSIPETPTSSNPQQPFSPAPTPPALAPQPPQSASHQQPPQHTVPRHAEPQHAEPKSTEHQHTAPQSTLSVATPQKVALESATSQATPMSAPVQQPPVPAAQQPIAAAPPPPATAPQPTTPPTEPAQSATAQPTPTLGAVKQPQSPTHPPLTATKAPMEQFELVPPPALDQTNLVNPVKPPPKGGWRKFLHKITAGRFNPGDSAKQRKHDELLERINTPLRGDYRIAVMSLKGGVGKTTTTATLGGILAETRGDRVIAIDANPDLGTLAQRVVANNTATIRDLLALQDTTRYPEIRSYTTQAKSRLEVVGSERDPAVSEAFNEAEYRKVIDILRHHYNIVLTDCGTGLMHSTMNGVLDLANALVLVTSPALDGAQSASATLDWLKLHGYEQLAANSVVVVSAAPLQRSSIDMEHLVKHFRSRTRAVQVIPYDPHLAEGATIDLDRIGKSTREAYLELAAIIAEDFNAWDRQPAQQ